MIWARNAQWDCDQILNWKEERRHSVRRLNFMIKSWAGIANHFTACG